MTTFMAGGLAPIAFDEIVEVARVSIEVAGVKFT
jgi:hypothetical protein